MVNNDDNQSVLDLVRVCKMHYEQGKTQAEIGAALGVSHAKISKMLAKSEELGLISISINDPFNHMDDLTRNLKEKYGLKNVAVAPVPSYGAHNILERLGIAAANLLLGMVHPGEIIGISGGRTLLEMLDKIKKKPLADSMIVPLLGGYGDAEIATRGSEIAYKLAEKFSARIINMPVPGLGRDAAEVAMFLNNPYVKKSIGWIRKCSIAVFGIGSADEDSSLYTGGFFTDELLGQLAAEQAVGGICFCYFRKNGEPCRKFNSRVIGMSLDDLHYIPVTIGVSGGFASKAEPIHAAIMGKYVNSLVTDQITAETLLKM